MSDFPIICGAEDSIVLIDNPRGQLVFKGNELRIVSKIADPSAIRLDAPIGPDGGGGGKISYNALREDGGEEELGFTIGRQRESVRGDLHNYSGELVTFARDGDVANADDATVRVQELNASGGGNVAPIPPAAGFPNKLVSPDGRLELDVQNADAPACVLYQDGKAIGQVPLGNV